MPDECYHLYADGYPDELIPVHCFTPSEQDPDADYYYTQEETEND
jgi:hypothetical protein